MREESVLLGFVEAVDFVNEENGVLGSEHELGFFGLFDYFADLGHTGHDGGHLDEFGVGVVGDDAREGGFAGAGWPPENEGGEAAGGFVN